MKHTPQVCAILSAAVLIGTAGLLATGQSSVGATAPPATVEPAKTAAAATAATGRDAAGTAIEQLGFLRGAWRGEVNGAVVEEVWSPGHSSGYMGCFRWLKKDGTPSMFEMLTITSEQGTVRLRLRHFSATLAAREAADKPPTLSLGEHTATKAVFGAEKDAGDLRAVAYELIDSKLHITVEFVKGEKEREPLRFVLSKQPG